MLDALQLHYLNIDQFLAITLFYLQSPFFFFLFSFGRNDSLGYFYEDILRKIVLEYCCSHVHNCYIVPVQGMGRL